MTAGADHIGDDLGATRSVAQALLACTTDSRCQGFNSGRYYKSSVANPTASGMCLYTKQATFYSEWWQCRGLLGHPGQAHPGACSVHWAPALC